MNKLFVGLCFVGMTCMAQIKGNKEMVTVTLPTEEILTQLEVELYANVVIDASASSQFITITGESNLVPLIDTEIVDGRLVLAQKEWIQPKE